MGDKNGTKKPPRKGKYKGGTLSAPKQPVDAMSPQSTTHSPATPMDGGQSVTQPDSNITNKRQPKFNKGKKKVTIASQSELVTTAHTGTQLHMNPRSGSGHESDSSRDPRMARQLVQMHAIPSQTQTNTHTVPHHREQNYTQSSINANAIDPSATNRDDTDDDIHHHSPRNHNCRV